MIYIFLHVNSSYYNYKITEKEVCGILEKEEIVLQCNIISYKLHNIC